MHPTCVICGLEMQPSIRGPVKKYCSQPCRTRANTERMRLRYRRVPKAQKACPECGLWFSANRIDQVFCSKKCLGRDSRTEVCERDGCTRFVRARGLCTYHYNKATGQSRGNRDSKRKRDRIKTQLRRAATRGADSEPVDRDEVAERDGWRCRLCGRKVNPRLAYPNPKSASLDHIIPLALDGTHTYANTQLTHLDCNMAKRTKAVGEQLALI